MAGDIKGITVEFQGDTTKLQRALRDVDKSAKNIDKELRKVNKALKFNPTSVELWRQKQELLKQKIDQTSDRLKILKNQQKNMDASGVDKNSAEYRKLQREIIETESKLKTFKAQLRSIGNVRLTALSNQFKQVGSKLTSLGRTLTSTMSVYGAAGIYAGKKLIEMSEAQAQAEQKLIEIYRTRMGVDEKAAQSTIKLAAAEQKLGVVGDEVQLAGAQQLATYASMPETVNTLLPALNNLLVQQKGLNGTQEDATSLANLFGKALMGQTGALKKAGISFSDAQAEVMKYGTEEEKAAMLAQVVTENVGHMNEEFAKTDAGKIQQAKNELGDMGEQIGAILLPAVAKFVGFLQENVLPKLQELISFFEQHPKIAEFALAITALLAVFGPLLIVLGSIATAIGAVVGVLGMISAPVLIVIAVIGALIAIGIKLYQSWDQIKAGAKQFKADFVATFQAMKAYVVAAFTAMKTAVVNIFTSIKTAVSNAWNTIKTAVTTKVAEIKSSVTSGFNSLRNSVSAAWNSIKNAITTPMQSALTTLRGIVNKIKSLFPISIGNILSNIRLPSIDIGSKSAFGVTVPTFNLSWHAKGGIFDAPSVIGVGEAGPEAVVPLDKFWKKLDKIAEGAGEQITINVYASDGMDVNQLAAEVERRLINDVRRRRSAWGY